MIEFDVLPERGGPIGCCSPTTTSDAARARRSRSRRASRTSARRRSPAIELDVDLKLPGYEQRVLDALREHGLLERALDLDQDRRRACASIRAAEPDVRLGWSVPKLRRDPLSSPRHAAAGAACSPSTRGTIAARPRGGARSARAACDALMCALAARHAAPGARGPSGAGGELYVWTVDDAARIAALERARRRPA